MRNKFLKFFLTLLILFPLTLSFTSECKAGEAKVIYPVKAVTIICPWSAGGGTDALARLMGDQLQKKFGKPFRVVNKTGGGGAAGHMAGALAKPDGYTLTLATVEIASMHWMGLTDLTVDNFDYVIQINQDPASIIVKEDAPWETINELLDDVKKNPGKFMFYGNPTGGSWGVAAIGMISAAGLPIDSVKWIPAEGAAPAITELLGGHIDVFTGSLPETKSQIDANLLRPIAIMSDERDPNFPNLPTLKELGINWSLGTWRGFVVPRGTPKEIIDTLYNAFNEIINSSEFKDFMSKRGFGIQIRNSEEFAQFAKEQDSTWKNILELATGAIK